MRKLMILAGVPLGVTAIGVLASSATTSAASPKPSSTASVSVSVSVSVSQQSSSFVYGEDGDDDDTIRRASGGGGGGGGGGSLAATGFDAASMALFGALTIAAGGATYRANLRRARR